MNGKSKNKRIARERLTFSFCARCFMSFCAVLYALLPGFSFCQCASRFYTGPKTCCQASESLETKSCHSHSRSCCANSHEAARPTMTAQSRCSSQTEPDGESESDSCCRTFVKSLFTTGVGGSQNDLSSGADVSAFYSALPVVRASLLYDDARPYDFARARLKMPAPLYLLLLVLRN